MFNSFKQMKIIALHLFLGVVARPSSSLDFSEINKAKTKQTEVSKQRNKNLENLEKDLTC